MRYTKGAGVTVFLLVLVFGRFVAAQEVTTLTPDFLGYPVPEPIDSLTPVEGFRSYDSLRMRYDDLWMQLDHIERRQTGESIYGREIVSYRFTAGGNEIQDVTPEGFLKSSAVIEGGIHAREWQSPETLAAIFEWLALESEADPVVAFLLENTVTVLHPLANPDGYALTQSYWDRIVQVGPFDYSGDRGGRLRRKNLRNADEVLETLDDYLLGVDLNRNHEPGFGNGSSDTPTSEVHRGESPGSEPESQALYAAADFAQVGGEDRIRYYNDVHSFGQLYYIVFDDNPGRNDVTERVYEWMRAASLAISGRDYRSMAADITAVSGPQAPVGSTDGYFPHVYGSLGYTTEIRPAGGEVQVGFILPDAQVDSMRREILAAVRAALYAMAGPPALLEIVVYDEADLGEIAPAPLYRQTRRYSPETEKREFETFTGAVEPGGRYTVFLRFNKPMRLLDDATGESRVLPGQTDVRPVVLLGTVSSQEPQWIHDRPGELLGYGRYPGDTVRVTLDLTGTPPCDDALALLVSAGDLVGQTLDADPATVADWSRQGWVGYESSAGVEGVTGGIDALAVMATDSLPACEPIAPWLSADVGSLAPSGDVARDGSCLRLRGGDGNFESRADAFHFAYQMVVGDVVLTARIGEILPTAPAVAVGLTVRESLEPGARHATLLSRLEGDERSLRWLRRRGVFNRVLDSESLRDAWLRVERRGDEFIALHSSDAVNWQVLGREIIELPAEALVGAVVFGEDGAGLSVVCDLELTQPRVAFLRGDCDLDGNACGGTLDAIVLLNWLFLGDRRPPCLAACDSDGSGELELTDAVAGLDFCFNVGDPPVPPFPECGPGTLATDPVLGCEMPLVTCQ